MVDAAHLRILIVDDDEVDRTQMVRTLKQAGVLADVTEAASFREVFALCEKQEFDCVFLDYSLPEEDGITALIDLHKRQPYLPIIMITGQGDERLAAEAIKRGAQDYIPKDHINRHSIRRAITNAQERTMLRRKLDEQRESLQNFARVLAHDLKAPSRIIRGFIDLMGKDLRSGNYDKAMSYFAHVTNATDRMDALIDALTEYTRLDGEVTFEPVSTEKILTDALANLAVQIADLHATVTHDPLPEVFGNTPQLIQLLQNLIGNGMKYCKERSPSIHIGAEPHSEGVWRFFVKDNGIGIPDAQRQRIFDPFVRLHSDSEYPGTGLGLATCKKVLEKHHGAIWCESQEGQGTTFFFTLPAVST